MDTTEKATVWLKLAPDQHALLKEFMAAEDRSQANAAEQLVKRGLDHWNRRRKAVAKHHARLTALQGEEAVTL